MTRWIYSLSKLVHKPIQSSYVIVYTFVLVTYVGEKDNKSFHKTQTSINTVNYFTSEINLIAHSWSH